MKSIFVAMVFLAIALVPVRSQTSEGPVANSPIEPIELPQDRPYPGEVQVAVDATDVARRVIHVHETVSGVNGQMVLLYPKWLPGTHAPEGPIDRIAGLKITAGGAPLSWTRDAVNMYAFHLQPLAEIRVIQIDFDYLSPTSSAVGTPEISPELMMLEWNALLFYPAGYFARQIPVVASITVPVGWELACSLERASEHRAQTTEHGAHSDFARVSLETLIDSPAYAGRHFLRLDLDPASKLSVHMDLFADRAALLRVEPEALAAYRNLIQQAYKLFGSHHYAHYDFLYTLSDQIQQAGLEHQQSSEDGTDPESFTEWEKTAYVRDLLPHEFTHSWNGKFRRPADLWTPSYDVPMRNGLLWVYEGQTEYWGDVLAARSGLRSRQQALDALALLAADYEHEAGRKWRPLLDTTTDEIINPRRPQSWPDWQRFEDYYDEGAFIWLDADTLIRERSHGKRSLDDFAHSFFGINDGSMVPVTYTFADIVKALNAVEPYDWATFLRQRLETAGRPAPLDGVRRGGYQLTYSETPSEFQKLTEEQRSRVNLRYSIGLEIDDKNKDGTVLQVQWNSPAYQANITEGAQILSVNGDAYTADVLKDAIKEAHSSTAPLELIVKSGERFLVTHIDYHGGARYPHLERIPGAAARLDEILAPRK
jgi:predicted metalloprotease with PDZ domain